jgi:hypothetical protein
VDALTLLREVSEAYRALQSLAVVRTMRVNEQLPEDTFRFVPPADATEMAGRCGVSMSGGGGFIEGGTDDERRLEHRGSHEWDGDTLVEHSKWKIRGMTLTSNAVCRSPRVNCAGRRPAPLATSPSSRRRSSWRSR